VSSDDGDGHLDAPRRCTIKPPLVSSSVELLCIEAPCHKKSIKTSAVRHIWSNLLFELCLSFYCESHASEKCTFIVASHDTQLGCMVILPILLKHFPTFLLKSQSAIEQGLSKDDIRSMLSILQASVSEANPARRDIKELHIYFLRSENFPDESTQKIIEGISIK